MDRKVILTCEHAGNQVPEDYQQLFGGSEQVLNTHRGFDIGALALAEELNSALNTELFTHSVTRLIVDLNRSLDNPSAFSEFTQGLAQNEKQKIIRKYYESHRNKVHERTLSLIRQGSQVLHLAVHTFTPKIDGVIRNADIGLLYDPGRSLEKKFCDIWKKELHNHLSDLIIRMNYPYRGTMDGFTTFLRKEYEARHYLGIELEVNQKFAVADDVNQWKQMQRLIAAALQSALAVQ